MTRDDVLTNIERAVVKKRRLVMANLNLHGMAALYESPAMARLLASSETRIMIDSTPLLWLSRFANPELDSRYRMTSLDYFDQLFSTAVREKWKLDYVGSSPEVLERGLARLRQMHPGLNIEGRDGYFDMQDFSLGSKQREMLEWMQRRSADILIVGMGMPRQEEWLYTIRREAPHSVLIPVGAYLDYQTGAQRRPPRWLGPLGLEWAHRLVHSPRRLWRRYLIEPFLLSWLILTRENPILGVAAAIKDGVDA